MKRFLAVLGILLVLLVVAVVVLVMTFDVNRYKGDLIALVERQTGRDFDITGDLVIEPSLIPTVAVEGVRIGNPDWAGGDLLTVERFEAQAALLPLLERKLSIERLVLSGAVLSLETDAQGTGNWVLEGAATPKAAAAPRGELPSFNVAAVQVENAQIHYRPHGRESATTVVLDSVAAATEGPERPLRLDLKASFDGQPLAANVVLDNLAKLMDDAPVTFEVSGQYAAARFSAKGQVGNPLQGKEVVADIRVDAESLKALGALAGAELPAVEPVALAATASEIEKGYRLTDLKLQAGRSDVSGSLELEPGEPRPVVRAALKSKLIDLTEFLPPPPETPPKQERMFSTEPLSLAPLKQLDGRIELSVANLKTHQIELGNLHTIAVLQGGRLSLDPLKAAVAGGALDGAVRLDAAGAKPVLDQQLRISGLDLAQLPKIAEKKLIEGSKLDLNLAVKGRGISVAEIMGSAEGRVRIDLGPGILGDSAATGAAADALLSAVRLLNPLSSSDSRTRLECAVINFPIAKGVATNETGIGIQTDKLNILGGGSIDLKTEKLDIGAKPKPREGIGLNLAGIADFVRVGGTLSNPMPTTDLKGAATAGVKVGAAIATGGLSILAEGLFDRTTVDEDVCAVARGDKAPAATQQAQAAATGTTAPATTTAEDKPQGVVESVGGAVKGVFKGIFGN
jgi:uncharacterized protein involved in outer membrane biogenesis